MSKRCKSQVYLIERVQTVVCRMKLKSDQRIEQIFVIEKVFFLDSKQRCHHCTECRNIMSVCVTCACLCVVCAYLCVYLFVIDPYTHRLMYGLFLSHILRVATRACTTYLPPFVVQNWDVVRHCVHVCQRRHVANLWIFFLF
jgi:hypothetical protein